MKRFSVHILLWLCVALYTFLGALVDIAATLDFINHFQSQPRSRSSRDWSDGHLPATWNQSGSRFLLRSGSGRPEDGRDVEELADRLWNLSRSDQLSELAAARRLLEEWDGAVAAGIPIGQLVQVSPVYSPIISTHSLLLSTSG